MSRHLYIITPMALPFERFVEHDIDAEGKQHRLIDYFAALLDSVNRDSVFQDTFDLIVRRNARDDAVALYKTLIQRHPNVSLNVRSIVPYEFISKVTELLSDESVYCLLGDLRQRLTLPAYVTDTIINSPKLSEWVLSQQWLHNLTLVAVHDFVSVRAALRLFPQTCRIILSPIYPAVSCDHQPSYSLEEIRDFLNSLADLSRIVFLGGINQERIQEWTGDYAINYAVIGWVFASGYSYENVANRVRDLLNVLNPKGCMLASY